MAVNVVAMGTWTYDGTVASPVWIVSVDFDFWHEVAAVDDALEPGETPDLNEDGLAYYFAFREPSPGRFWPDGGSFRTVDEAQRAAAQRVPTPIRWDTLTTADVSEVEEDPNSKAAEP